MKAAIYCRVSTSRQEEEGTSLDTQLEQCRAYAETNGHEVREDHIFLEQYSGADLILRPMLSHVRELVADGIIETVIVYSTDRLSRDQLDLPNLVHELNACFVSGQSAKAQTPEDILMLNVHGYTAATERRAIRERTMRGKRQRAKTGAMPNGDGAGLYGYKPKYEFNKAGKPERTGREVIEEEAAIVRRIFEDFDAGVPKNTIATRLNQEGIPTKKNGQWHPRTLLNVLRQRAYTGDTKWGTKRYEKVKDKKGVSVTNTDPSEWVDLPGYTPAIINESLFESVQKRIANPTRRGRPYTPYLLAGRVKCGYCETGAVGQEMAPSKSGKRYRYYTCRGTSPTSTRPAICSAHRVREDRLEEMVTEHISTLLADPVTVLQAMTQVKGDEHQSRLDEDISRLRSEITNLVNQEKRYIKAYALGELDDDFIKAQSGPVKVRREQAEEELKKLQAQRSATHGLEDVRESLEDICNRVAERFKSFNFDERRLALEALNVTAIVTDVQVEINAVLGVEEPDPRLITTGQTSA